ncbi:4Fe-4S dicluster domain-containing protein [Candidatus Poribacteria bacterium]
MRDLAVKLFEDGSVNAIIGYENGTLPLRASPCVIKSAQEADRLVWNMNCGSNLVTYLLPLAKANPEEKIGIITKGCDSRSVVGMLKERQIERDQIVVIGVPCSGVIDRRKIDNDLNGVELLEAHIDGDTLILKHEDGELQVNVADYMHSSCSTCQHKVPILHDVLVGEPAAESDVEPYGHIEAMESMSADERWDYFVSEMSKCIRCYACREGCPFCYCTQCFVDQNQPRWFGKTTELSDTIIFHLVRAFHVAGRCVNCGACARACPMGVDLMSLTKKIEKDMDELYGYMAGMDVEELAPFATFKEDDPQEFITEPG